MKPNIENLYGKNTYWYSNLMLRDLSSDRAELSLIRQANALRVNALSMIQNAGSGHPGTSLSVADIAVTANFHLNTAENGIETLLFSSKGHDAPLMYALLSMNGEFEESKLRNLRRLNGLPGHPDVAVPGIFFNTGSLGLGISKAKGLTLAARKKSKDDPEIIVILGDGELQEGQIWESLLSAARDKMSKLTVVVDANEIQSDASVANTLHLGNLRERVIGSGWEFIEVNGHSSTELLQVFSASRSSELPTFVLARTKKGAGVTFMMGYPKNVLFYPYHSGSLSEVDYEEAIRELVSRIEGSLPSNTELESSNSKPEQFFMEPKKKPDNLVSEWSKILLDLARLDKNVIVLDADLSLDTGTYQVAQVLSNQYHQCGIAEQDMFSQASGLAAGGMRPIVHSFACFLMRAVEQCFNNSTELRQVSYVGTLAGVLPAMPGHSHQAVLDVGVMQTMPGMKVFEPSCKAELVEAAKIISQATSPTYLRLNSFTMLQQNSKVVFGEMTKRMDGKNGLMLASSPVLANEAIEASRILRESHREWSVYTYPWLSEIFGKKDLDLLREYSGNMIVLEDHLPAIGISTMLNAEGIAHIRLGATGIPPCGQAAEVLADMGLDSISISKIALSFHD